MRLLILVIALAGCREKLALEPKHPDAVVCPALPDAGAVADLALPSPMPDAAPPDLTMPRDLAGADLMPPPDLGYPRVSIYEVLPLQPLRVGDDVTVLGRGFVHPTYMNTYVLFGNVYATLIEKSDSRLTMKVPSIGLPANGAYLDLVVSNGYATDSHRVAVIPLEQPQSGHLEVFWHGVDDTTLTVGQPRFFTFRVRSALTKEAQLGVSVTALNASVFVSSGSPFPRLAPSGMHEVTVRVIPKAAGPVRVRVAATADGLRAFTEVRDLVAPGTIDTPDFDVELISGVPQVRSWIDDIAVADGALNMAVTARLLAGTYDLSATSPGWTVDPSDVGTFTIAAPNALRNFFITFTPDTTPPPPTTLTVRIQRQGSAKGATTRQRVFPAD